MYQKSPQPWAASDTEDHDHNQDTTSVVDHIGMECIPCISPSSSHHIYANQVDMYYPFVGMRLYTTTTHKIAAVDDILVAQYGNPALDVLQSYIDALVKLGHMDDAWLGRNFFTEYKANIIANSNTNYSNKSNSNQPKETTATTTTTNTLYEDNTPIIVNKK